MASVDRLTDWALVDIGKSKTVSFRTIWDDRDETWQTGRQLSNEHIARYFATYRIQATRITKALVRRVPDTPIKGQWGVVANFDLAKGTTFALPKREYTMGTQPDERDLLTERNTFQYPIKGDKHFVVDTTPGTILRSFNSAWNGLSVRKGGKVRASYHNASIDVFPDENVVLCHILKKVPRDGELFLAYEWYADETEYAKYARSRR